MRIIAISALSALVLGAGFLSACTSLKYVAYPAHNRPDELGSDLTLAPDPTPPAPLTRQRWEEEVRPALRQAFQDHVYGPYPENAPVEVLQHRVIDGAAFDGQTRLEEVTLRIDHPAQRFEVDLALALPADANGPVPLFLIPNDCGNDYAFKDSRFTQTEAYTMPYCAPDGLARSISTFVFGRYVQWPPIEALTAQGFGVITYHEGQIVADNADLAAPILDRFHQDGQRPGVISLWAWSLSRVVDYLDATEDYAQSPVIVMGHSRRGKAALWVGAMDERIDMVIAHQSGTGGATLSISENGEPLASVTESYPHWFTPDYGTYAGREDELPVDQHQLIALNAPRPVLLGNAWRDVWSDPEGAFQAGQAASPAYALYGGTGLDQARLRAFHPDHDIAFHIRSGTHGIVPEDWEAFLAFVQAHLASE